MKIIYLLTFLCFIIFISSCNKTGEHQASYLTLERGESAYETYDRLLDLYNEAIVFELVAADTFTGIQSIKSLLPYYCDLIVQDSVHPDTMESFRFEFDQGKLHAIQTYPSLSAVDQFPVYHVADNIIDIGMSRDFIYESLFAIHTQDTIERIKKMILIHKDLETRFTSNMYSIDTWYALEIGDDNENYTIELQFEKGVLESVNRYKSID